MNITPIPPIDSKLIDFKLTPGIKIGEVLEGIVEEVLENKTYLFRLKEFTFRARSPLILKKHDRIRVEIKSLEPRVVFKLLPTTTRSSLSVAKKTINKTDTNYLYFTTSNLSSWGVNNLSVKTFNTDEETSPKGTKSKYHALDILLEMSELGKVLVKITHHQNLSYYQIVVEDKNIKEFVDASIQNLLTDLKNAGYNISNINCTINPNLKDKHHLLDSTISRTEKGYSRVDVTA